MALVKWRAPRAREFTVIVAGDFCPRECNWPRVAEHASEIVGEIKPEFDACDLRILQWECAVTDRGEPITKSGPNLRCGEPTLNFATALGIDVALLANNHTGDYGPAGVTDTIAAIRKRGIATVGAGADPEEAAKPLFLEHSGVRIAILNFCENEFGGVRPGRPGTNPLDPLRNLAQIRETRPKADVLLVTVHGGHEYNPYPSPRMVETYRAFAEAGADAVWNCHTHCPEGSEIRNGVPIIYSPGNFYFPPGDNALPSWKTGYLSKFYCDEAGVYALETIPYGFDCDRIRPLKGETKVAAEAYLAELARPLSDPARLQSLFESWCTKGGAHYIAQVNSATEAVWPPDWSDPETIRRWIHVRNLFNCESHTDLLRHYTRLIEERRFAEARKGVPEIEALQTPGFITW